MKDLDKCVSSDGKKFKTPNDPTWHTIDFFDIEPRIYRLQVAKIENRFKQDYISILKICLERQGG